MPKCREIVWINYPFSSQTDGKHRPSVLISGKNSYGDFICLPITRTNTKKSFKINDSHIEGKTDLTLLKLLMSSYVSFEQPMTITVDLIDKKPPLATITEKAYQELKEQFCQISCP